ncbi:MAG: hypothetical protein MPW14_16505 [Candidatus Manganitrophus sp.]|nr:MAG: hypothetical protein MPW14_16505 [Candidatus Manganitrophus sp.]
MGRIVLSQKPIRGVSFVCVEGGGGGAADVLAGLIAGCGAGRMEDEGIGVGGTAPEKSVAETSRAIIVKGECCFMDLVLLVFLVWFFIPFTEHLQIGISDDDLSALHS